jgi:hypothetical protein
MNTWQHIFLLDNRRTGTLNLSSMKLRSKFHVPYEGNTLLLAAAD